MSATQRVMLDLVAIRLLLLLRLATLFTAAIGGVTTRHDSLPFFHHGLSFEERGNVLVSLLLLPCHEIFFASAEPQSCVSLCTIVQVLTAVNVCCLFTLTRAHTFQLHL
jgi:hypothetical protein